MSSQNTLSKDTGYKKNRGISKTHMVCRSPGGILPLTFLVDPAHVKSKHPFKIIYISKVSQQWDHIQNPHGL